MEASVRPVYSFTGDPSTIDRNEWPLAGYSVNGESLYYFSSDVPGVAPKGDGLNHVWHLYHGQVLPEMPNVAVKPQPDPTVAAAPAPATPATPAVAAAPAGGDTSTAAPAPEPASAPTATGAPLVGAGDSTGQGTPTPIAPAPTDPWQIRLQALEGVVIGQSAAILALSRSFEAITGAKMPNVAEIARIVDDAVRETLTNAGVPQQQSSS